MDDGRGWVCLGQRELVCVCACVCVCVKVVYEYNRRIYDGRERLAPQPIHLLGPAGLAFCFEPFSNTHPARRTAREEGRQKLLFPQNKYAGAGSYERCIRASRA